MAAGKIMIPEHVAASMGVLNNRAIVIAIGADAWSDEKEPRAAVGDKVIVTKLAGAQAIGPADGLQYRLVNDRDIYCVITAELKVELKEVANG